MHRKVHPISCTLEHFFFFNYYLEASYDGLENENCISVNNIFLIAYLALLKGDFQSTAILFIAGLFVCLLFLY